VYRGPQGAVLVEQGEAGMGIEGIGGAGGVVLQAEGGEDTEDPTGPWDRFSQRPVTRYERKAGLEGRGIWEYEYRLNC
jgi:hypothetical protein